MSMFFKSDLEKQLEELYANMLGKDAAKKLIATAKAKLKSDSSISTPPIALEELGDEGVTDSDYEWWWALQPVERAVMLAHDEASKTQLLFHLRSQGAASLGATVPQLRRAMPLFGNPRHEGDYESPDDRPLPRELKQRVSGAATSIAANMSDRYTSMNAFIRELIRNGQL
jgi:hypothetical protein